MLKILPSSELVLLDLFFAAKVFSDLISSIVRSCIALVVPLIFSATPLVSGLKGLPF